MNTDHKIVMEISALIVRFLLGEITGQEQLTLREWLAASPHNRDLFENICNMQWPHKDEQAIRIQMENAFKAFLKRRKELEKTTQQAKIQRYFKFAASWFLFLCLGGGMLWSYYTQRDDRGGKITADLSDSCNRPILTLPDGQEIMIGGNNFPHLPGIEKTGKDSSTLVYTHPQHTTEPQVYHILSTPVQCDYHFILSDGTKVWLNAKSSLKFPVPFGENERIVYASGEVFLEVAKDTLRPFCVETQDVEIRVVGTTFNVKSYSDDYFTSITLVEGKVATYVHGACYELLPDRQLFFDRDHLKAEIREVNTEQYISWKEGMYIFNRQSLAEVTKILERWYDVKIIFENKKYLHDLYTGIVYKEENLKIFLERLSRSSKCQCQWENNIVYIK